MDVIANMPLVVERVKIRKLSQAIELGCCLSPRQAFAVYHNASNNATCALGAAYMALGGRWDLSESVSDALEEALDVDLHATLVDVPDGVAFPAHKVALYDAIVLLNDEARWSRERIAAWLREMDL